MRTTLLALLALGCADPVGHAPQALIIADDAGTVQAEGNLLLASGETVWGESTIDSRPTPLLQWEEPTQADGTLSVGSMTSSPTGYHVDQLNLRAGDLISIQLGGIGPACKYQNHPNVGGLYHCNRVAHWWFGNALLEPADITFQGTNSFAKVDAMGTAAAQPLTILGQGMHDAGGAWAASTVVGGDVQIRGGQASSAYGATRDPGEIIIGGGRVETVTRGNVALHDEPSDWCAMEGGLYVHDAATVPTSSPTGGGFLYADGGALYWRGSAGTVTQLGAP